MQPTCIKETAIYIADVARTEAFYGDVLQFERFDHGPNHVTYRVGSSILLYFMPVITRAAGFPVPHGATGSQHLTFEVPATDFPAWRQRLAAAAVPILHERTWRPGVQSIYFHDPDGHLLEIVQPGLWDRPSS